MKNDFPGPVPALFRGIEAGQLDGLLSLLGARRRDYLRGETVLRPGDPCRIGIVLTGQVQIIQEDRWGGRTVIGLAEAGDLFGEAFVCAGESEMPVGVCCASESSILLLDGAALFLNGQQPPAAGILLHNLLQIVSAKAVGLIRKNFVLSRRSTREKLLSYLSAQASQAGSREFSIPFDRQQLADYLAVERSAMSAELGRLRREGVLETRRNRFVLHLPDQGG